MKVGLVTFCMAPNFGAFLQSVASNFELKRRGADVTNFDPNQRQFYTRKSWRPQSLVYQAQAKSYFRDRKAIELCPTWIGCDGIARLSKMDAIFVGSDQVLNPKCLVDGDLENTLLSSISGVPKFGLAMSTYSTEDLETAGRDRLHALSKFDRLSFREDEVLQWVNSKLGIDGQVVPDPCFLLSAENLLEIAQMGQSHPRRIQVMVSGYDLQHWAPALVKSAGVTGHLRYINFQYRYYHRFGLYTGGPLQALQELLSAEVVVTNSFHFAVVGIIARKKVIVPYGQTHDGGARLRNLVAALGFVAVDRNVRVYDRHGRSDPRVEALRQEVLGYIGDCLDLVGVGENA